MNMQRSIGSIFNPLKQILEKSPGTRTSVTGRPHIQAEMERRLTGRVISVPVCPSKDDIIRHLRAQNRSVRNRRRCLQRNDREKTRV